MTTASGLSRSLCSRSALSDAEEVALDTSNLELTKPVPRGKLANWHPDLINVPVIGLTARLIPPRIC